MATKTFLKLSTILFLLLLLLILPLAMALSTDTEEEEDYESDNTPLFPHLISRSRFLASIVKKGARCDPSSAKNICNGVLANKGTELLQCCKKKCVNVLADMNHCGQCGQKCSQGERCCNGVCTNVMKNVNHCGKCNKKCKPGIPCQIGFCGYA